MSMNNNNNANNIRSFSPTAMAAQIPVPPPINTQRPPSIHQPQPQTDINQLLPPLPPHHHPTVRSPVYQPFPGSVRPEQDFEKRQQQQALHQQQQQQFQQQQFHSPPFSGGSQLSPASPNHRSPSGGYYHQQQQQQQQYHHQQQQSSFYAADNGIAELNRSASSDNSSGFTSIENLRVNLSTTSSISHSSMSSSPQYQRNLPGIMNNNYHHNVERSSFSENSSEISLEDHLASLSDGMMNMNTSNHNNSNNNSVSGSYNYPTNPAARMKASPTNSVRSSSLSSIGSLSTGGLSLNTNITNPPMSSNAAPLGIAGQPRDSSYSTNNSMFHDPMFWNK
jgi:hypothetical protein